MKRILLGLTFLMTCTVSRAVTLISLNYAPNVAPAKQQVFAAAANFLNNVILGYDLTSDADGSPTPHGLVINISTPLLDGVNGVLGQAGPDTVAYYDDNPLGAPTHALWYTDVGIMEFDSADIGLMSDSSFYGVVLHEMLHVLGVGTLWEFNNNVNNTVYQLYTAGSGAYTGPNALNAWRTEFNQPLAVAVPVELDGGVGTAQGHWNEQFNGGVNVGVVSNLTGLDFQYELMTGWANQPFYLSTVTLGSLDDLGYQVDYSKAGLVTYVPIPEPASLGLLGVGLLVGRRRRVGD